MANLASYFMTLLAQIRICMDRDQAEGQTESAVQKLTSKLTTGKTNLSSPAKLPQANKTPTHKYKGLKTWHPPGKSKSPKVQYSRFLGQHSVANPCLYQPHRLGFQLALWPLHYIVILCTDFWGPGV